MKTKILSSLVIVSALFAACNNKKVEPGTYVELNTGDSITVMADPVTGYAINAETKKPVYLYVNNHGDTIFTTGRNVNHLIVPISDGKYEIDGNKVKIDDGTVKVKYADYQEEYDVDYGDSDYKTKTEADGSVKIKEGDYKKKIQEDGDIKIKTGDTKTKIEDGKVETKKRKKLF